MILAEIDKRIISFLKQNGGRATLKQIVRNINSTVRYRVPFLIKCGILIRHGKSVIELLNENKELTTDEILGIINDNHIKILKLFQNKNMVSFGEIKTLIGTKWRAYMLTEQLELLELLHSPQKGVFTLTAWGQEVLQKLNHY